MHVVNNSMPLQIDLLQNEFHTHKGPGYWKFDTLFMIMKFMKIFEIIY